MDRGTYGRDIEPTVFVCSSHVRPGRFVAMSCPVLLPSFQRDSLDKPSESQQRPCNVLPKSNIFCDFAPPSKGDWRGYRRDRVQWREKGRDIVTYSLAASQTRSDVKCAFQVGSVGSLTAISIVPCSTKANLIATVIRCADWDRQPNILGQSNILN